jgi:hypothetical protein
MKVVLVALFLAVAVLMGCSHVATYNPTYLSGPPPKADERLEGKVLVYTEHADDSYVFSGAPTSFTGGATKLTIPLGQLVHEVAVHVFARHFKDGADSGSSLEDPQSYRAIVRPRTGSFSYQYNQLKNLGFAITPTVILDLDVDLIDQDGNTTYSKQYSSGPIEGGAYMVSGTPGERINQLAHETAYKLLDEAARDIKTELLARQP